MALTPRGVRASPSLPVPQMGSHGEFPVSGGGGGGGLLGLLCVIATREEEDESSLARATFAPPHPGTACTRCILR